MNINNNLKGIKAKSKNILLGNREKSGLLIMTVIYFLLINIMIIYFHPLLDMISTMLKSNRDLMDTTIDYIPREPTLKNLTMAFEALQYFDGLYKTLLMVIPSAILQVVSCAFAGYAFSRMDVPGKKVFFILLILAFIIPPEIISIPMLIVFKTFGFLNTPLPFIIPAVFGHGLKAPLFVIIYMQYFKTQPKEIEDAARIDGSSTLNTFWKVMFPMAKPAMIVVFLFSVIWHWNETFLYMMFNPKFRPLSMRIDTLRNFISGDPSEAAIGGVSNLRDAVNSGQLGDQPAIFAACFLVILPTLLLYIFAQRWFTEGIERTGLVE